MGTKVYGEQLRFIPECSASGRLMLFRPRSRSLEAPCRLRLNKNEWGDSRTYY